MPPCGTSSNTHNTDLFFNPPPQFCIVTIVLFMQKFDSPSVNILGDKLDSIRLACRRLLAYIKFPSLREKPFISLKLESGNV